MGSIRFDYFRSDPMRFIDCPFDSIRCDSLTCPFDYFQRDLSIRSDLIVSDCFLLLDWIRFGSLAVYSIIFDSILDPIRSDCFRMFPTPIRFDSVRFGSPRALRFLATTSTKGSKYFPSQLLRRSRTSSQAAGDKCCSRVAKK